MAEMRHFMSLAHPMQSMIYPGTARGTWKGNKMTASLNNALAAVAALTLTVLCMATAIVPASPAGLLA